MILGWMGELALMIAVARVENMPVWEPLTSKLVLMLTVNNH